MKRPRPARQWIAPALLALAGLTTGSALAQTVETHGATFAETVRIDDRPLQLSGTGTVRYRLVFTVYAAALHLPPQTPAEAVLAADTPRRLTIEYFHDISAEDIIRAANTKLAEQLTDAERERLGSSIEQFHDLFRPVSEGDRYRMDYQPETGTTLYFNGEPLGTVPGGGFAAAYFGIWLDAGAPLSASLRRDLLAGVD
jgi:hypothetical protein